MPIYEYTCRKCGEEFEKLVLAAGGKVVCPKCSSARVGRRMSAFAAKTSAGFTPSKGGTGCSGCSSSNCGSCR